MATDKKRQKTGWLPTENPQLRSLTKAYGSRGRAFTETARAQGKAMAKAKSPEERKEVAKAHTTQRQRTFGY
jgi:hypothetical protein